MLAWIRPAASALPGLQPPAEREPGQVQLRLRTRNCTLGHRPRQGAVQRPNGLASPKAARGAEQRPDQGRPLARLRLALGGLRCPCAPEPPGSPPAVPATSAGAERGPAEPSVPADHPAAAVVAPADAVAPQPERATGAAEATAQRSTSVSEASAAALPTVWGVRTRRETSDATAGVESDAAAAAPAVRAELPTDLGEPQPVPEAG